MFSMLLLPLLYFWAHAPMHFSTRSLRALIVMMVMITMSLPYVNLSSHQVSAADPFGPAGSPKTRSGEVFRGGDRDPEDKPEQMREGTLIPPTSGRVALVGRRWAFVPDGLDDDKAGSVAQSDEFADSSSPFAFRSQVGRSQRSSNSPSTRDRYASPARSIEADLLTAIGIAAPNPNTPQIQMLIGENLMLQRIVEAIRLDASDDRWTVSGEVTEFFDQNRLIIRTAQRANVN